MNSIEYRVRSGDTLLTIARRHKVSVEVLSRLNGLGDIHRLWAGQVLKIPNERPPTPRPASQPLMHRVRAGQTLSEVAQNHKVTVEALTRANGMTDPDRIVIGQVLTIPKQGSPASQAQAKKGTGTPGPQATRVGSPSTTAPKRVPFDWGTEIGSFGRVRNDEGVNLREAPDGAIKKRLPFNTRVFVSREFPGSWYFVTLDDGSFGYVYLEHVSINPPEPGAILHKIKKNEGALQIVKQYYKGNAISWGQDERYYVNVLVEANRRGKKLSGIYKPDESADWSKTQTRENYLIWIPTLDFAKSLRGKVSSGSISYEAWEAAKRATVAVGNFYLGEAAFVAGLIHGVLESIWDLLTGIVDLVKLVWDIIKSVFTGQFLSDLKGLWELVSSLSPSQLIDAGIQAFLSRWNASDFLRRWHFRGWVVGYAIAEILMAVVTGSAALVKWAGKAGKFSRLISKFPKVLKLAERVTEVSKRVPGETLKRIKQIVSRSSEHLPTKPHLPPSEKPKDQVLEAVEAAAKQWLKRLEHLKSRIARQADKFKLIYSEAELKAIAKRGQELGLSDHLVDDLIFTGSREAKALSAMELMEQMKEWAQVVRKRGYPHRFKGLEEFQEFSRKLLDGLHKAGLPIDDVRIQGSALRTAKAKDVDVAAFVDKAAFGELLTAYFHQKIAMSGQKLSLKGKSYAELLELVRDIGANPAKYNAHARTFEHALKTGVINSKSPIVKPLKELAASLASTYPHLNLETVSILIKGGLFDLTPDLPVVRH
jgi:LysM repeat protein